MTAKYLRLICFSRLFNCKGLVTLAEEPPSGHNSILTVHRSSANEQRAILAKQQNRRLLRRAHDDASSYYSKSILSSPSRRDTVEFEFENQLIDSAAYRSAYRKYTNSERASASHAADRKTGDVMTRETSRQESLAATDECSISETLKGEMKSKNKISAFSWWRTEGMHSNTTRKRKLYTLLGAMVFIIVVVLATVIPIVVMRARNLNPSPTTTGAPTSPSGAPEPSSSTRWSSIAGYPPLPLGAWSLTSGVVRIEETSECARPATAWSCFTPNGNAPTNTKEVPIFHFNITAESDTSETPTPSIPDDMDYRFLGNNTDQTTTPFEGLNTPFSISFLSPSASQQRKRAEITDAIPPPSLQSDGRIAQPSLLPIPTAQPLRLFDKGLDSEHYGFYVYFDKTILLHSINQSIETDEGGASPESAKFAVTWAETRFRVSIGTKNLQREVSNGEFPLSTTFLLDRHGGAPERKMLYAYGFLDDSKVNETDKVFLLEDRAWGGTQVNPAGGSIPFTHSDAGGFDGGSGGCNCVWKYIPE